MKRNWLEELSPEELAEIARYRLPFEEENLANIKEQFKQKQVAKKPPKKIKKWRLMIGVAAIVSLLVAFTHGEIMIDVYKRYFGTPLSSLVKEGSATSRASDNGLTWEVKSSFKDGDMTYVVSTLTDDLKENRLATSIMIDNWRLTGGGFVEVVDYDEQAQRATLYIRSHGKGDNLFKMTGIKTDQQTFYYTTELDLTKSLNRDNQIVELADGESLGGGRDAEQLEALGMNQDDLGKGLILNGMREELDKERGISLSNMAYKDGLLHVQVEQTYDPHHEALSVSLVKKSRDKTLESVYSTSLITTPPPDDEYGYGPGTNNYVFALAEEELADYQVILSGWTYGNVIRGEWLVRLNEVPEVAKKVGKNQLISLDGKAVKLSHLRVSPISVSFELATLTEVQRNLLDVEVIKRNGKVVNYAEVSTEFGDEKKTTVSFQGRYTDLAEIDYVLINGQKIDVN